MIGGIEAGGTKFICGIGDLKGNILDQIRIPTTTPEDTLAQVVLYFKDKKIRALGVASFGPIDPIHSSPSYGYITKTPKLAWSNFNLLGYLSQLNVPMVLDTDVNAAALAESKWGAGLGLDNIVYLTIGTGVGGGAVIKGKTLQGMLHPEMGHMRVPRLLGDDFIGICPFHQDCLEGLVSGPAILKRTGVLAQDLPSDHPSWSTISYYLAQAIANIMLILSPQRIILGGGVMQQTHLFSSIYDHLTPILGAYIEHTNLLNLNTYIVAPSLDMCAGLRGSLALGMMSEL